MNTQNFLYIFVLFLMAHAFHLMFNNSFFSLQLKIMLIEMFLQADVVL